MRHRRVMKRLHLLGRLALEPNRAPIGRRGGLIVDGLHHAEGVALVPVKQARVPRGVQVAHGLFGAQYAQLALCEGHFENQAEHRC